MAKAIPQTLKDTINEEPDRFIDYLNLNRIFSSTNPYREFLRQFEKAFGRKQGLNLWQYVLDRYYLLNELYKNEAIQVSLPDEFKGSLNRSETKKYFEGYLRRVSKVQERKDREIKKPIIIPAYFRKDIRISGHSRTKPHDYTKRQERFILSRKDFPTKQLANEFNRAFGTSITQFGIREKLLRLQDRKI